MSDFNENVVDQDFETGIITQADKAFSLERAMSFSATEEYFFFRAGVELDKAQRHCLSLRHGVTDLADVVNTQLNPIAIYFSTQLITDEYGNQANKPFFNILLDNKKTVIYNGSRTAFESLIKVFKAFGEMSTWDENLRLVPKSAKTKKGFNYYVILTEFAKSK